MSSTLIEKCFGIWRRGRDSNPGKVALQRFSRPPQSTALPPLQQAQILSQLDLLCNDFNRYNGLHSDCALYKRLFVFMLRSSKYFKQLILIILVGVILNLTACKTFWSKDDDDDDDSPFKGQTAKKLYIDANDSLKKKNYGEAIKRYEALETMYPFNDYAEQAELNLIYSYYKKEDYASAAATAERFIHLYPRARRVDYAYYMKGLANYHQLRGNITTFLGIDQSWRDPGTQSQAYSDFATLVQKFPESRYKANAMQRMIYLRNMFAQSELNVSKYYFERHMYVAATERANYLIRTYPQAPSVKEALIILYHANLALGLKQAAEDARTVYQATYHKPMLDGPIG